MPQFLGTGVLAAIHHGPLCSQASELAQDLQRRIYEIRGEIAPQRVLSSASLRLERCVTYSTLPPVTHQVASDLLRLAGRVREDSGLTDARALCFLGSLLEPGRKPP